MKDKNEINNETKEAKREAAVGLVFSSFLWLAPSLRSPTPLKDFQSFILRGLLVMGWRPAKPTSKGKKQRKTKRIKEELRVYLVD